MTDLPYIVSGTVKNQVGLLLNQAIITIQNTTTNTIPFNLITVVDGSYTFDLANIGYTAGDTIKVIASDRFNNETKTETFIVSGESKTLNIELEQRTDSISPKGNRDTQISTVGGKAVTEENPLPVTVINSVDIIDLVNNPSHEWTITREDQQPDDETITIRGAQYRRTFTYTSNVLTARSKWEKVT